MVSSRESGIGKIPCPLTTDDRLLVYGTFAVLMPSNPQPPVNAKPEPLYCPKCAAEVTDPLTCGDCSAVICRRCGTPLESPDELGMG